MRALDEDSIIHPKLNFRSRLTWFHFPCFFPQPPLTANFCPEGCAFFAPKTEWVDCTVEQINFESHRESAMSAKKGSLAPPNIIRKRKFEAKECSSDGNCCSCDFGFPEHNECNKMKLYFLKIC